MIDPDTCAHGRALFSKCIFCGGTAKKPPEKGSPIVKPRELAPATPGERPPVKEAAHRPPDAPRKGKIAVQLDAGGEVLMGRRKIADAARAAEADLLAAHERKLEKERAAEALTPEALTAQTAERLHKGDTVPAPPLAESPAVQHLQRAIQALEDEQRRIGEAIVCLREVLERERLRLR